jgi:LPS sulfotransferase NodH
MLGEDIAQTEVLGQCKEGFGAWVPAGPDADYGEIYDTMIDRNSTENGVCSIQIMANQIHVVNRRIAETFEEGPGPLGSFFHQFSDAVWVHLKREDTVAQAVSRDIARQTNVFHSVAKGTGPHRYGNAVKGYDPSYNQKAEYDFDRLWRVFSGAAAENAMWEWFFESHGIAPVRLVYEHIADDPDKSHLDTIAEAAGMNGEPLKKGERRLIKLSNATNDAWKHKFNQEMLAKRFSVLKL